MQNIKIYIISLLLLLLHFNTNAQEKLTRKSNIEIGLGIGRRAYINSKSAMFRSTFAAHYLRNVNELVSIRMGPEIIYWDIPYDGANKGYLVTSSSYENFAYGFLLGADVNMSKVSFTYGLGKYLYYKQIGIYNYQFYTRLGFKFKVHKNLYFNSVMRSHGLIADYIDFGFSIKL